MSVANTEFWVALLQIIMINIVLSGDNAVVIALASRSLPPAQQKKAILFGSVGAIVMRLVLTFFAVMLLSQPYLKLVGAALLLWIGVGLRKGGDEDGDRGDQATHDQLIALGLPSAATTAHVEAGDPADKNLYDLPPEELAEVPTVCGSLREALNSLAADNAFLKKGDVFTDDQIDAYMDLKYEELDRFETHPHPVEFDMYYSA